MELIGKTAMGEVTYQHKLENKKLLWICPDKEEIVVERMGKIRKVYFSVVNEEKEKVGVEGKFALQEDEIVFLNIIFENEVDYAEFYERGKNEPSKKYLINDEKLYLKDGNDFWLVKKVDDRKIGIDSEMIFLEKSEENEYKKSTEKLDSYRKMIVEAFEIFFKLWKNKNN